MNKDLNGGGGGGRWGGRRCHLKIGEGARRTNLQKVGQKTSFCEIFFSDDFLSLQHSHDTLMMLS
jgi:hypothetical protein